GAFRNLAIAVQSEEVALPVAGFLLFGKLNAHSARMPLSSGRWSLAEGTRMAEVVIRSATVTDLGTVRDIYNYYVARSTCTFQVEPDTEAERLAWFRDRLPAHPVTVAELAGEVVGWAALSAWKSRCAYAH